MKGLNVRHAYVAPSACAFTIGLCLLASCVNPFGNSDKEYTERPTATWQSCDNVQAVDKRLFRVHEDSLTFVSIDTLALRALGSTGIVEHTYLFAKTESVWFYRLVESRETIGPFWGVATNDLQLTCFHDNVEMRSLINSTVAARGDTILTDHAYSPITRGDSTYTLYAAKVRVNCVSEYMIVSTEPLLETIQFYNGIDENISVVPPGRIVPL